MKRFGAILLGSVLAASCNGQTDDGAGIGGETHFLVTCGEGCGPGLSCIDGVCTRHCEPGFSSCTELAASAACVGPADEGAEASAFSGTCDVPCAGDGDCSSLGTGYLCTAGACRAEPEAREAELESALRSNRAPKVMAVDTDTCDAGLRWVGGNEGSAEMHPGSDCVGCHRETGARPLMFGGTVYAKPTQNMYKSNAMDPLEGCFGLEGITVQVTDGNGREYVTVTNRAGNFYVEGRESDLVPPYSAKITFSTQEQEQLPFFNGPIERTVDHEVQMYTTPFYGGCARCHTATAVSTGRRDIPGFDESDEDLAKLVTPAGSVIFPPGLYPDP
jgi:hypothetical protein